MKNEFDNRSCKCCREELNDQTLMMYKSLLSLTGVAAVLIKLTGRPPMDNNGANEANRAEYMLEVGTRPTSLRFPRQPITSC